MRFQLGRLGVAGVVGVVLAAAVAGCVSIPTTGAVHREALRSGADDDNINVEAQRPRPGYSPGEIVTGFVTAMGSGSGGIQVARAYLTPAAREAWKPEGVTVIDNDEPKSLGQGRVDFEADQLGSVGADGAWQSERNDLRIRFKLVRDHGQWRIQNPPKTLLMSSFLFDNGYARYELFFYDADSTVLVPDPVLLPKGSGVETRLVNALLRGPTKWLSPAVRSAFPTGTKVAAPAVSVQGTVATVDLSESFLSVRGHDLERAAAQIAWTLKGVRGIDRVRLTVNGQPISVGGEEEVRPDERVDPAATVGVDQAYAVKDGRVVQLQTGHGLIRVSGLEGEEARSPRAIAPATRAMSRPAKRGEPGRTVDLFGLISKDGRRVYRYAGERSGTLVYKGNDVSALSWDLDGKLWMADNRDGRSSVLAYTETENLEEVPIEGLSGQIRALRVSRDGTRLAMLVERSEAGRTELVVGRIDRGRSLAVRGLRVIPVPLRSMTSLSWSDTTKVVVAGHQQPDRSQILEVPIDGWQPQPIQTSITSEVTGVAAAPGGSNLLIVGEERDPKTGDREFFLLKRKDNWTVKVLDEARSPAFPG